MFLTKFQHPECECLHQTCGPNCDRCCPLYNQRAWGPGSSRDARICQPCNCNGHATSCIYDENVEKAGLSMDTFGKFQGGGVCVNCTVGLNKKSNFYQCFLQLNYGMQIETFSLLLCVKIIFLVRF